MLLSNIKILILEDSSTDIRLIKEGLFTLENEEEDKFDKDLVYEYLVETKDNLYKNIKQKILKDEIDVLFIDLNLFKNYEDGLKIIKKLIKDEPKIKNIPKYILSSQNVKDTELYKEVEQFTNLFIQKPGSERTYEDCFIDAHIVQTLPIIVDMYREIKKSFDIEIILATIKYKLDRIKINTDTIKERTYLIENMNQTMIKLMPQTIDNEKQKEKLKNFIKNDMSNYLKIDEDNFFPEKEDRNKFVDEVSKQFDEMVEGGFKKETWGLLKKGIKDIAKTQDIDDENAGLCAVKLLYRAYSQVAQIARGEA